MTSFGTPTLNTAPRRRPWLLPTLGTLLGILMIAVGLWQSFSANRTELVQVWARPVVAGQVITPDDVTSLALPVQRPPGLATLPMTAPVAGRWATRTIGVGELVTPDQLSSRPPTIPRYANGEALPAGMVALPISTDTSGPVTAWDAMNIGYTDPTGDPTRCQATGGTAADVTTATDATGDPLPFTCRLISGASVLWVEASAGMALVAVTPYQAQAFRTVSAIKGTAVWAERWAADAPALPFATRLDPLGIDPLLLSGPMTTTNALLPGTRRVAPDGGTR